MNQEEFIDLCVLCGCDYTSTIGGMGPVTAFKMLKENGDIEGVLKKVRDLNEDPDKKKKYMIPENFLYSESRELFKNPDVIRDKEILEKQIVFDKPNETEMMQWLINDKGFAENKVVNGLERLKKCSGKKNQTRLDCFFKAGNMISSCKKVEAPKGKGAAKPSAKGKGRKSAM